MLCYEVLKVKEPKIKILGFDKVFDTIHILTIRFNPREKIVRHYILNETKNEDLVRFDSIYEHFNMELDRECDLFFNCSIKPVSFMSEYYTDLIHESDFISFEDFIAKLRSDRDLKKKVLSHYLNEYENDDILLNELLLTKQHTFSDEMVKGLIRLVLFFSDVRDKLIANLEKVGEVLDSQYLQYQEFLVKQCIDNEVDKIKYLNPDANVWYERQNEIKVKFVLINPNMVWRCDLQKNGGIILGIRYERNFNLMWNSGILLTDFCEALGDKVRFKILEKLKNNCGGMSIAEIAKATDISISNVIYHMEKLKKVKLISYTMKGKTAFYYVNSKSIRHAIKLLEMYAEEL